MRYSPQIRLPEIGKEGQKRITQSRILIVGCGALGSPIAMYLAGSGVGKIVLADFDTVDLSNLHRQIFYSENEVGKKKVECLGNRLKALNSEINVDILDCLVTAKLLNSIDEKFDVIIDAADNPSTTYLLNSWCKEQGMPFSTAGVSEWRAQVFTALPDSLYYDDIFAQPVDSGEVLPCSVTGIVGAVAGCAASLQALEVLKILIKKPNKSSSLVLADFLSMEISTILC